MTIEEIIMDSYQIKRFADLGLSSSYGAGFMPFNEVNGQIVTDYDKASKTLAQDAAMSTKVNVGVPAAFSTYIDPKVTTTLFAVTNATQLFSEARKGDWTTQYTQFPVEEQLGGVTAYSDFSSGVSSDVNYEFPTRENFVFETVIKYGMREAEMAAKAQLSYAGGKQNAAANIIARAHNRFYLQGVANKQNYGALNDPNLPAAMTPLTVNGKTTWADKMADPQNAGTIANVIYNDVTALVNKLIARNGGNVDQNSDFVLAVAPDRATYLTNPNQFGKTALELLKVNYPNLKIINLPELQTQAGSVLYLTVPSLLGEITAENAYSEKMRFLSIIPDLSSFKQKAVGGTYGCVIRRPSLIASMIGI